MRPHYHYAASANWLSDPNGLVHANGEWHLFYQYNPDGEHWDNMCWGHAVSRDLAHWQELAPALMGDELGMIFSGSAVIDHDGTAGFGRDAMVAIYTSATLDPPRQAQSIAFSTDDGRSWHKYSGNPVLDRGLADFRDPNVFWHKGSGQWIMVVALSDRDSAAIYGSPDLKTWHHLSDIFADGAPGHLWECPLLIELPVEGAGERRWMFKVDVLQGGPGSGAIYRTGTFDGSTFRPDADGWQCADAGSDFYAAIAWHDPRDAEGRPLWVGWLGNHAYQARLPLQGWRGAMSVPRLLSLVADGQRFRLRQEPAAASIGGVERVDHRAQRVPAAAIIDLPANRDFAVSITDQHGRSAMIAKRGSEITVRRHDPSLAELDCIRVLDGAGGGPITILLDHGSLELLADGGLGALSIQHRMQGAGYRLECSVVPAPA